MSESPPPQEKQSPDDSVTLKSETAGRIGFGIDQPGAIIQLVAAAIITIATGFVVAFTIFRKDVALGAVFLFGMPIGGFLILAVAASLYWSSRVGKPREVGSLMKEIPWGGSEIAVDVGCGRGLMMVSAATRLDQGLAVGVDLWKAADLSGNDPRSVWANARADGVLDRVVEVKADARHLPFWDGSVDVAMSSMTIHIIGRSSDRQVAVHELIRILKGGGRIAILDAGRGPEYADIMRDEGLVDVHISRLRFRSFPPLHSVTARKPFPA